MCSRRSQRSRENWLRDGDKNTMYFHSTASRKQKKKRIERLETSDGIWTNSKAEIEDTMLNYFQGLFASINPSGLDEVVQPICPSVSAEMNQRLTRVFIEKEVKFALFQMHPTKAPGPNGFPVLFFQKFWDSVGKDVCQIVLDFLNENHNIDDLNYTYIVLIPKVNEPRSPTQFRPISLCNVVYKVILKVLANKLKKILPCVISKNQSAFIPGRLLSDNVIIVFEIFQFLKNHKEENGGCFALILYMSKAYDRVEWAFIQKVMLKMGINAKFVEQIMRCISSVSYSVVIDGEPSRIFHPSRGLHPGDPISPYLFLICAEALSSLIQQAKERHQISEFKFNRYSPCISHLFFADDSLLFAKAMLTEAQGIVNILQKYEQASRQKINFEKSRVFFSKGVGEER